jgi:mRNA-degrading endonuclease RelE of RelBE toxin-antitoxin system
MKIDYNKSALDTLKNLPMPVRKAFYKQAGYLLENLLHPSLRAKKFNESENIWQARVNRDWRFYFKIEGDTYIIVRIIPHPK